MSFFTDYSTNYVKSLNNAWAWISPPLNTAEVIINTMLNPAIVPTNYSGAATNTNQGSQPMAYGEKVAYAAGGFGVGTLLALGLAAFVLIKK